MNKIYKYGLVIAAIMVVLLYVLHFYFLNRDLITVFDEAYYYLSLNETLRKGISEGISQWRLLAVNVLGAELCSNILSLRYISSFLNLLSVLLFWFESSVYLKKRNLINNWKSQFLYAALLLLLSYYSFEKQLLNYNDMQFFFILNMVGCYLMTLVLLNKKVNYFLYSIIGFFSFLSILTVPPSGMLVSFSIILMLSIYLFKDKKNRLAMIAFFSLGFIISLLLFHFCIKDLTELYREVIHSSQQLMGASRGYSAKDHLFRLGFYLRDFFIIFCLMTGLFTLSKYVSDRRKNLAWLVFGLGFIIFMFYQKKPPLYMTLVLSSFFVVYFVKHFKNIHNFKNFDSIQYLFFLLLPLLSIMGTNTPYAGKMAFFMPLWGVLFCEIYKNRFMKGAAIISLVLAMLLPSFFSASRTAKTQYHYANYEGPARGMFLDNKQNAFFEKVDGLLKEYGYVPQKDYMFTTIGSQMTICIFDAKPCGIFQQPADFLMYANKNKLTRPDFLILNEWDLNQMAAVFDSIGWNFSNGYDKSFVGSPDNNEDKWLFCAKERKNQYIKKYGK